MRTSHLLLICRGWLFEGKTENQIAIKDYEEDKKLFDQAILNKEYDVLTYFVWSLDGFSNFAATGGEVPTKDFSGIQIQDLTNIHKFVNHIYYCVFPENKTTYAIIAWFKKNDTLFGSLEKKLSKLSEEEKKNFINNTITISCENIVIKPSAWDALPQEIKKNFEFVFRASLDIPQMIGNMEDRLKKPPIDFFAI